MSTRTARALAKEYLAQISQGQHPKASQNELPNSHQNAETIASSVEVTLSQAWQRYLDAHLIRKNRSEKTIAWYRDHVERIFAEWLDTPLRELGADPARIARRHDDISNENGSYIANGAMRTLRAIYNHARKTNKKLPPDNPADAVDWNLEKRRDTGMGIGDLKTWLSELAALDNPVRREFHLFTLLSGSRPAALQEIKPSHLDLRQRTLHVPKPKGGGKRAFDIPLSREMICVSYGRLGSADRCIRCRRRSGFSQPTAPQGIWPKRRKIGVSSPSGAMIFGRLFAPLRQPPASRKSTPSSS
jgi:integrase